MSRAEKQVQKTSGCFLKNFLTDEPAFLKNLHSGSDFCEQAQPAELLLLFSISWFVCELPLFSRHL